MLEAVIVSDVFVTFLLVVLCVYFSSRRDVLVMMSVFVMCGVFVLVAFLLCALFCVSY